MPFGCGASKLPASDRDGTGRGSSGCGEGRSSTAECFLPQRARIREKGGMILRGRGSARLGGFYSIGACEENV
jgi:hypothetical protein